MVLSAYFSFLFRIPSFINIIWYSYFLRHWILNFSNLFSYLYIHFYANRVLSWIFFFLTEIFKCIHSKFYLSHMQRFFMKRDLLLVLVSQQIRKGTLNNCIINGKCNIEEKKCNYISSANPSAITNNGPKLTKRSSLLVNIAQNI